MPYHIFSGLRRKEWWLCRLYSNGQAVVHLCPGLHLHCMSTGMFSMDEPELNGAFMRTFASLKEVADPVAICLQ